MLYLRVHTGNDYLNDVSSQEPSDLLVQMITTDGEEIIVKYDSFSVSPESEQYQLTVGKMTEGTSKHEDSELPSLFANWFEAMSSALLMGVRSLQLTKEHTQIVPKHRNQGGGLTRPVLLLET